MYFFCFQGISQEEQITSNSKDKDNESSTSARLPRSLRPIHYTIYLRPFLVEDWKIEGEVTIELVVNEATNKIMLNMADIISSNDTAKVIRKIIC